MNGSLEVSDAAARELVAWSQEELAGKSGVSLPTIQRLEAEGGDLGGRPATGEKIIAAFEKAGVEFIDKITAASACGSSRQSRKGNRNEKSALIAAARVLAASGAWASCCRHHPRAHWYYQGYNRQDIYRYGPPENGGYRGGHYGGRYHDNTHYND